MVERLQIQNFGPIKSVDIELTPIMVFIGNQATGKSTISKLIALFRGWDFIFRETQFQDLLLHYNISSYLTEETVIIFSSKAFTFEYKEQQGKLLKTENHIYHTTKAHFEEQKKLNSNAINKKFVLKELENIKSELTSSNPTKEREDELVKRQKELTLQLEQNELYQNALNAFAHEAFKLENYSEYIPSERIFVSIASGLFMNLQNNKVPLPANLISFGAEFEKARTQLKKLDVDFLRVEYKYENNEDRIYVGKNKFIPFKESASGLQTILPMLLVIYYKTTDQFNGLTFIVEEPELNLFPITQKHLCNLLIERCTTYEKKSSKFMNELVVTTHSPYILSALNNLLFAHIIGTKRPEIFNKIELVIPKKYWINHKDFSAYTVEHGQVKSIIDTNTLLISESELDSASEEINSDFEHLMDIFMDPKMD